jgi:hypothetical protein
MTLQSYHKQYSTLPQRRTLSCHDISPKHTPSYHSPYARVVLSEPIVEANQLVASDREVHEQRAAPRWLQQTQGIVRFVYKETQKNEMKSAIPSSVCEYDILYL